MNKFILLKSKLSTITLLFLAMMIIVPVYSQEEIDNPNLDQVPKSYLERAMKNPRSPSQVITVNHYDNYYLGNDFAEGHISANPNAPTEYFTAFNTDGAHYTNDGHDWLDSQPSWGASMRGDPVTAYDGDGNLFYENMYGSGSILGCKVARSSDNGETWDFVTNAISGFDKNWIACDQTSGPYANYVYTTMTGNGGGRFARSTDNGATWQNTWVASTQSLPGMMVCVGPEGNTDGGAVYAVTNGGNTFASTYTFYKSNDGGATFDYMSAQNFAGYVGTNINGRHSVENMRTRPYPFITSDNSDGDYRGRLHLVYASNDPPGNGMKPDIWSRYSDDGGATWSDALRVNSGHLMENSHQFQPAVWCDVETGKLYVQWMDSRNSITNDSAAIYATYSDDGGQSFKTNIKVSNQLMVINCNTCGGGGSPRYQGDYNGIVSNENVANLTWGDFRWGTFASFTAYFPDFAMYVYPSVKSISYRDTIWAVVPSVKLYDSEAIFTAEIQDPGSGSFTITYPEGQSLSSFPDSIPIVITIDNVPLGDYFINVRGEGPNSTPIHYRESLITVIPLPLPVAEFEATETDICVESVIDFTDQSLYNPISWEWTFEGGSPETSTEQNPTGILYSNAGLFDVTLSVTNNTGTNEITKTDYINVVLQPEPPVGEDISVCIFDSIPPLEVTGTDVLWYADASLDSIIHEGNIYSTGNTEPGVYSYFVTQSNGICTSISSTITQTINPLPDVTFDILSPVCENNGLFELTNGSPTGGNYFGMAVDTGFFDPSTAGEGTHTIGYVYADDNSCSDTAYQDIVVYGLPDVTQEPLGSVCMNNDPFGIPGGNPENGNYEGNGVEDNVFYPETAGPGEHLITYIWADTTGCVNTASQIITVYPLPQVDIGNDTSLCAERMVVLNAESPDAISYLWTPGNYTTPSISVDSTGIGLSSQEFSVEVTDNNGCINTDSAIVGFYDCTGIDEIIGLDAINIFPNPNDGNFTLNLVTSKTLLVDVKIFNASGSVFYSMENVEVSNNYSKSIGLTDLRAGIYFLLIENDSGKIFRKILIK